jgi:hypothetical protein
MKRREHCNLLEASVEELLSEGYIQVNDKKCIPGDLLCAANTSRDLWIELSAWDIKKSGVTGKTFVIFRKV